MEACLRALETQTVNEFEVIVIDNSGAGRVHAPGSRVRVITNERNVGFGAAVNQAATVAAERNSWCRRKESNLHTLAGSGF